MAEDALVQLAGRLRALRGDTGLTLRELSRKLHVSDSSLSRYFAAQALPPWEVVEALGALAGADQAELRRCWESVTQARKRARWPELSSPAVQRQPIPLWEPEVVRKAPASAVGAGRRAGLLAGVVVLVATACAVGRSMHGDDHTAVSSVPAIVPVPAAPRPSAADGIPAPAPSRTTPPAASSPGPRSDRPATPPPGIVSRTSSRPVASPSRKPTSPATSTAPTELLSGTVIALTTTDSSTGSVPYVIDVENWSMDDGAPVHLWNRRTDGDYRNQLWTAEKVSSGHWRFVNKYSSKCLYRDAGGGVFQTGCASDATQEWDLAAGEVRSAADGTCVEINGHQRLIGAGVRTAACDGGWYQLWHTEQRSPAEPRA